MSLSSRIKVLSRSTSLLTAASSRRITPSLYYNIRCYSEAKKDEPESSSRGVADPGTSRHGYDPLKPRKPLNRIHVGQAFDANKAEQQATVGFINWKAALFFILTGGGLLYFFKQEKKRLEIEKLEASNRGYGKPLVGGPFNLIDQNGNPFTEKDLLGKFSLIYFGFSMCPDICPDELEKMAEMLNEINKDGKKVTPVFVTCDPARDSPEVLKEYLAEFHPDIIGLTGSYDDIKQTCKAYRVYFSTPPDIKPGQDYLVDHSIFFYFMDPEGKYVDVFGRQYDAPGAVEKMKEHMAVWQPSEARENSWSEKLFGQKN